MAATSRSVDHADPGHGSIAVLGSTYGRLVAGPRHPEDLDQHRSRLGAQPGPGRGDEIAEEIGRSGLGGRGGGYFPLARKLQVARESPGRPVVVVNATEGEPAVRKDRFLMAYRPHLVLDGAEAIAAAAGADRVLLAVHEGRPETRSLLTAASSRRAGHLAFELVAVPDRYVAGESSALVSWINGGAPRPSGRTRPSAVRGVGDRPTIVSNAETAAHAALIARFGADWFAQVETPGGAGSALITVGGSVTHPGAVVELTGPATVGQIVAVAGGPVELPKAVLVGGYTGTWIPAHECWGRSLDSALRGAGGSIGCGLVGVMGSRRCGLVEASNLARWLASERAGQCGSCDLGLPLLAETLALVASGARRSRRAAGRIVSLGQSVSGRGLCGLPDGTVSMVESALQAFGSELELHRRGRCSGEDLAPLFPLPGPGR